MTAELRNAALRAVAAAAGWVHRGARRSARRGEAVQDEAERLQAGSPAFVLLERQRAVALLEPPDEWPWAQPELRQPDAGAQREQQIARALCPGPLGELEWPVVGQSVRREEDELWLAR